jgi:hypothetical protein
VERETEKREPANFGKWCDRLRLRCHAAAERLAAGDQRQLWQAARGLGHCGADGGVREPGRVRALATLLHIRELVAQRRDPSFGEFPCDRGHEWMGHAGAGAVRQHITGPRAARRLEQAGDAGANVKRDR